MTTYDDLRRHTPLRRTAIRRSGRPAATVIPIDRPAATVIAFDRAGTLGKPGRASAPSSTPVAWPAKVREAILVRDDFSCWCCGRSIIGQPYSIQHRDSRGMGGTRNPAFYRMSMGITMLGTGTTLCHGRVEHHDDPEDGPKGYRLKTGQNPLSTPVWRVREFAEQWFWLTNDGRLLDYNPFGGEAA